MTKHLAVEWGLDNVRVNGLAIGTIDETEGFLRLLPSEVKDMARKSIPLQRFGKIQDVANLSLFLASPAASWITGAIISVDGGSVYTQGGFNYPDGFRQLSKL
jgi:peroxisomal 2,4-dienoyl-CoA reductase